jgi:hypothetical protein
MVLQVAAPHDMLLLDPPCLRSIDTRIQTKEAEDYRLLESILSSKGANSNTAINENYNDFYTRMRKEYPEIVAEFDKSPDRKYYLNFIVYFRSWDLWAGLPSNLAGIANLMEYISSELEINNGEMIVESKGLHLYGYSEDLAKIRCLVE